MALERYLQEEVALDHADGHLSRREALRRLAYLGLGAPAAAALLAACSRGENDPVAETTPGATPAGPTPSATEDITFPGPGGRDSFGAFATAEDPRGAVLVIHENRGLTDHIKSVAGRFATSGYAALSVDLLSAAGGTGQFADEAEIMQALSQANKEDLVADMVAAIDELERRAPDAKVGAIGFCFGGGMVWELVNSGEERLAAAAPFYGTTPDAGADFSKSKAAVLGVYAELDDRVNATRETARQALEAADLEHEIVTYPGVNHAFFNATGDNYNKDQAEQAYAKVCPGSKNTSRRGLALKASVKTCLESAREPAVPGLVRRVESDTCTSLPRLADLSAMASRAATVEESKICDSDKSMSTFSGSLAKSNRQTRSLLEAKNGGVSSPSDDRAVSRFVGVLDTRWSASTDSARVRGECGPWPRYEPTAG